MPFDGTTIKHAKLLHLADVLDDRSRWPAGFEWSYSDCRKCGIGLAARLGYFVDRDTSEPWETFIIYTDLAWGGIPLPFMPDVRAAVAIFGNMHTKLSLPSRAAVTPEHVSAAIRQWVSENA